MSSPGPFAERRAKQDYGVTSDADALRLARCAVHAHLHNAVAPDRTSLMAFESEHTVIAGH
jgi:hypothetical protein